MSTRFGSEVSVLALDKCFSLFPIATKQDTFGRLMAIETTMRKERAAARGNESKKTVVETIARDTGDYVV